MSFQNIMQSVFETSTSCESIWLFVNIINKRKSDTNIKCNHNQLPKDHIQLPLTFPLLSVIFSKSRLTGLMSSPISNSHFPTFPSPAFLFRFLTETKKRKTKYMQCTRGVRTLYICNSVTSIGSNWRSSYKFTRLKSWVMLS